MGLLSPTLDNVHWACKMFAMAVDKCVEHITRVRYAEIADRRQGLKKTVEAARMNKGVKVAVSEYCVSYHVRS